MKANPLLLLGALPLALAACGTTGLVTTGDAGPDGPPPACADIGNPSVTANDELGYPPYAMQGCRLVYVDAQSGDLVLQPLGNGAQQTLEVSAFQPRRPAVASNVIAWEATMGSLPVVRVLFNGTIGTMPVPQGYDHITEPAVATSLVVITAWRGPLFSDDTDVLAFDPALSVFTPIVVGPKQQRFSAASDTLVAVTDFSEDPNGYYTGTGNDLADIGVYTRSSGAYVVRAHPGKDAFPAIMSNDVLGYLHWGDVHPEPKLEAYSVYVGHVGADPSTDTSLADVTHALRFLRPSAASGVLEWVTSTDTGTSALWRYDVQNASAAVNALSLQGTLLGSVTLDHGTLLAESSTLHIVAR